MAESKIIGSGQEVFKTGNWFHEKLEDGLVISFEITDSYHTAKTAFQTVDIIETKPFGRCLITDRLMQSAYKDERVYHESLVQPAMAAHACPKKVFIGGGGEGATLREVLRHKTVEECVMVDIDGEVVQMCKEHLTQHHAGAYDDPRAKLIIDDCKVQLEGYPDGYFDVIILDLSDPLDGGPCYQLYTTSFYSTCKSKLAEGGVFVTQSGCGGLADADRCFTCVHSTLKQVFPKVSGYTVHVPSFTSEWGFNLAIKSGSVDVNADTYSVALDGALEQRGLDQQLQWYDGVSHRRMFSLGKQVRKMLANETRVMTVENPLFMTDATCGVNC